MRRPACGRPQVPQLCAAPLLRLALNPAIDGSAHEPPENSRKCRDGLGLLAHNRAHRPVILACLNEQNGLHSPSCLPMNRTYPVWLTAVGIALARSIAPDASEPPPRPNMVVIVADDLGWANVGYHGSSIPTPRLDDLAAKGRRLEQHYVSPVCSPTRTALMTGRYASRFGVTTPQNDRALPFDTVTIARALNSVGYDTALAGKWHLGSDPNWGPQRFGFDDSYGSLAGGGSIRPSL